MQTKPRGLPKTGGRKKGVPNKVDKKIKERIAKFVEDNFDDFEKYWKELPPSSPIRFNTMIHLLRYILPVPSNNEEDEGNSATSAVQKSINDLNSIKNGKDD